MILLYATYAQRIIKQNKKITYFFKMECSGSGFMIQILMDFHLPKY